MIAFWNTKGSFVQLDSWQPNCWVQVTCPTPEESEYLEKTLNIPDYFMADVCDTEERARYDVDEGWLMIIMRVPHTKQTDMKGPYITIPLGILIKEDKIITICNQYTKAMIDFVNKQISRHANLVDAADLVFRLFLNTAHWYLKCLKHVGNLIDKAKLKLNDDIDNQDLIKLSRLQDSLTYFATSIRGNETLLTKLSSISQDKNPSKIKEVLHIDELDADLIDDAKTEMNQARETTSIYNNIIDSAMDTYANIINNNMNKVMRILTSLNMIIMFPTLITSAFGMNLINGMEKNPYGFYIALVICGVLTIFSIIWFKKKKWL